MRLLETDNPPSRSARLENSSKQTLALYRQGRPVLDRPVVRAIGGSRGVEPSARTLLPLKRYKNHRKPFLVTCKPSDSGSLPLPLHSLCLALPSFVAPDDLPSKNWESPFLKDPYQAVRVNLFASFFTTPPLLRPSSKHSYIVSVAVRPMQP